MNTYFQLGIEYRNPDSARRTPGGFHCGDKDFNKVMMQYARMVVYYADMNYIIERTIVEELCATCNGQGTTFEPYKKQFGGKHVKCCDCKGKGVIRVVFETKNS